MNLILIVFFSVLSYAKAVSDEDKRCAWGESFWCSSIENAKVCQAIDHCKDTVWTNQKLGKDASEVCQFCEAVVEDVVQFIEENKTETELMNFLASACDLVPDKTMSSQCKLIVESYTPVIINLIKEKVEPQVVCGLIGLCKGFKDSVEHQKSMWTNEQIKTKDAVICADCKKFAQDFKEWLTSTATEQQIANQIDQMFCKYLGSMEGECKNLVQLFLPEIMQFFSDSVGSTEDCTICKTIMGDLQNLDRDKNVQDEIENLIKTEICARLSNYKSECELTVDLYAPELFELLATELDPVARCQSFGFCPAIQHPPKVHISAECVLCEFVMKELKSLIGDNATEAEIIAALEKVCKILPSTIRDQCTSFVDIYGKAVINLILQDISPEQICTILGLCNSSSISTAVYSSTSATKCEICTTLVGYVEALIDQNSTVMEIDRVVMKICNFLPDSMKQECSAIIQEFGGLIVHYIATSIPPKEVCTLIKLCPAELVKMELLVPAQKNQASYYKCSYGPSYWCTSQANAELCQAVDHCKKYVW